MTMSTLAALGGNLVGPMGGGDDEETWAQATRIATQGGATSLKAAGGPVAAWKTEGTGLPIDHENSSLELEPTYLMKEGREPSNEEIIEYVERHGLQAFLTETVMYIARHFPPDPYDFLLDHVDALVMKHRASKAEGSIMGISASEPLPEPPPPPPEESPEEQQKIVQRVVTVLQSPAITHSTADKWFAQFAKGGTKMSEEDFTAYQKHAQTKWGLQPDDQKAMKIVANRWRFRANAAAGTRGMPLWPMEKEDFRKAYPCMLRKVRDRYVPIGAMIQNSLFIREASGILLDKYTLGAKLGRGAFGEVILATLKSTGEKRVVKRCDIAQQQKVPIEELMQEIELLRAMDHPHITRIFEYFVSETHLEMIIEPVFGGTLTNLIRNLYTDSRGAPIAARPEALDETWVATFLSQILSALTYAHDVLGIIHKDLKCDNIMLVGRPKMSAEEQLREPVHAMLADFGIAEIFSPHAAAGFVDAHDSSSSAMPSPSPTMSIKSTRSSRVGGTCCYMSPEMFKGSFTEKCDVWSLGVIVFQMMTGELPYRGDNLLMQAHIVCCPRRHPRWEQLSLYKWGLGARWFCQQLLSKDEGMRPTAAEASRSEWILKTRGPNVKVLATEEERRALHRGQMQSHLKTMSLHCITSQLNLSQLTHLNLRFQQYDSSGDGRLSHVEMRQVLADVGIESGEEVEMLIEALDCDHSGAIEYSEFIAGSLDVGSTIVKDNLRVAFDIFDLDGSGTLSFEELRQVLTQGANAKALPTMKSASSPHGRPVQSWLPDGKTVEQVMAALDQDGNGCVNYPEFERYLLSSHSEAGHNLLAAKDIGVSGG